ncbi:hypothetical protein BK648_27745 [Pseudomonas poae]|uniref:Uncharacterized protein n=1 Tax=Pseudomonas poae TaxID=200451 RepID=A0A423EPC1_9PSED|nr:hypothetical protein [Pseudomonas poae]ROM33104.1 hypothetical protein BK648_27745 [Pseudomonas poae]
MKPKSVGFYLLVVLLVYFVVAFFVLGIIGNLIVSIIGFLKFEVWRFDGSNVRGALRVGLTCGVPMGVGIWALSKIKDVKSRKHKGS